MTSFSVIRAAESESTTFFTIMFLILIEIKVILTLSLSAGVHLTHLCVEGINVVACVPGEKEQLGERKAQLEVLGKDGNLKGFGG